MVASVSATAASTAHAVARTAPEIVLFQSAPPAEAKADFSRRNRI